MVFLYRSDRKFIISKPWRSPVPKANLAAPSPGVRALRRDQVSRHSKQLQPPPERQHNTTVNSPQQMAGNVCRFFTKVKELIIWSWSYLWALWFLLVISVVYYLRGPLKITDNIGMGECRGAGLEDANLCSHACNTLVYNHHSLVLFAHESGTLHGRGCI